MNNVLKNAVCYLSGPMQYAPDDGLGWRKKFIELSADIGLKIIDPTNKPNALGNQCHEEKGKVDRLKKNKSWDELTEYAKSFVRFDLRACDLADMIVAYLDPNIFTVGTIHEILVAENQQKPIFLILEGGKERASAWLFGILDHRDMFNSVEDCVNHLKKINSGQIPLDNRWVLIRDYLESENANV